MKKLLAIAAIVLLATSLWAGEKEDLLARQELLYWKSKAIIPAELAMELKKIDAEFKANESKLKDLEAKEKKDDKKPS